MKEKIAGIHLSSRTKMIALLVMAAILLILPVTSISRYTLHIIVLCFIYTCLTLSLNLIIGWSGQFSLGHVTFYGMGAYITTLLVMNAGLNFFVATIISVVLVAIFSMILCFPTLNLRGDYLAVVTLGFGEVFRLFITNAVNLTRGPMGIPGIPAPTFFGITISGTEAFYYIIFALMVIFILFMIRLNNSGFGLAMLTVKEDDIAAISLGISPVKYKMWAFVIGGGMAALMGSFYAVYLGTIGPTSFVYNESIKMVSMVVLGGMGSVPGSVIGAFLLTALPEMLRQFSDYRMILYGAAMAIMMIFRPNGIWGIDKRVRNEYKIKAMRGVKNGKSSAS
ncbi:MAG: branched-chain amino acid ABC transporter permease [Lachnospiraceae bacterium]|nr:branched-chain amino acid ABC transporter permease [Lachnospiraceae bacterium]